MVRRQLSGLFHLGICMTAVLPQLQARCRSAWLLLLPLTTAPCLPSLQNDCFDAKPAERWFQVLPLVVQSLPMLSQRATYVRAFLWAMPERCQQFGVMVRRCGGVAHLHGGCAALLCLPRSPQALPHPGGPSAPSLSNPRCPAMPVTHNRSPWAAIR